jgi:hypothetical protein
MGEDSLADFEVDVKVTLKCICSVNCIDGRGLAVIDEFSVS